MDVFLDTQSGVDHVLSQGGSIDGSHVARSVARSHRFVPMLPIERLGPKTNPSGEISYSTQRAG
jgi:hypothetical protein